MNSFASSGVTPSVTSAINRQILRVSPTSSVAEVIRQMSATSSDIYQLADHDSASPARVSCAVVEEAGGVVGIVTERDIVRLTATKLSLLRPLTEILVKDIMTSPVKTLEESAFEDIFAVLFLFRRYRIRHLPIVDAQGKLTGLVTPASIRQVLRPANLLKMRRVANVMSRDVVQAPMSASVMSLAKSMADHRVSCVVIVDTTAPLERENPQACPPVGIVTERDIVQFQSIGLDLQKSKARQVMSSPLFLLDPQDSLWSAHQAMQKHHVRRLVVSWNWGRGLGIVTQTCLLRVFDPIEMCGVIDSLQQTVEQMNVEQMNVEQMNVEDSAANTAVDRPVQALLTQSIECLSKAQSQLVNLAQQEQLQKALQLVEHVSREAKDELCTSSSAEPVAGLVNFPE
ncbi:MAG: CBS domain-containing protein [Phormidesmis sp.]